MSQTSEQDQLKMDQVANMETPRSDLTPSTPIRDGQQLSQAIQMQSDNKEIQTKTVTKQPHQSPQPSSSSILSDSPLPPAPATPPPVQQSVVYDLIPVKPQRSPRMRPQIVKFTTPIESFDYAEQDPMNQYCRMCCCECPVWMGLLMLTMVSQTLKYAPNEMFAL